MSYPQLTLERRWEQATRFDKQPEFNEMERYFIDQLLEKGFVVRFDKTFIYARDNTIIATHRSEFALPEA